jgi:polar amino acid transport system substrate-binding protein
MIPRCWLAFLFATACGACDLPRDPGGTLERVRGHVLRVGVSHNPPWTDIQAGDEPNGTEVELIRRIAEELGAGIEWEPGGEMDLMIKLERREVDLVIGGLTSETPWKDRVGLTRPHTRTSQGDFVLATPPGENAWIVFLDREIHDFAKE